MSGSLLARGRIRRMIRVALSLAAAHVLAAPMAFAQVPPRGARLSYTRGPGTEGCPEEPSLRQIVASQLGGIDPFVGDGAWHIEVIIRRKGPAFHGEIALHDRDGRALGRQEHSSAICGVLVEDIGLSLSAIMRPLLPPRPAPGSAPTSPPPGPPPRSAPRDAAPPVSSDAPPEAPASKPPNPVAVPARPVPRPRPPPDRPRLQLGAGVLLGAGVAPSVAVGFSGFAGARWERFSLSLEARGDLPIDGEPYRGWTIAALSGSLVPCGHADWFFGCALATAGRVWHVRESTGRERALPYAALGLRAGLQVPLSARLAVQLTGDLSINTIRPSYRLPHGEGWKAAPISEAVALRLIAFF
ncbi:hypothetical protein WME95_50195 [Sorangium sp. So ce327]|jgi:hypothetical protein|uniref:hypothetical protein n=1 Tax=Sorangium sp. So ce327 TaxID=3133301 RepID=UPI003F5ED7F4